MLANYCDRLTTGDQASEWLKRGARKPVAWPQNQIYWHSAGHQPIIRTVAQNQISRLECPPSLTQVKLNARFGYLRCCLRLWCRASSHLGLCPAASRKGSLSCCVPTTCLWPFSKAMAIRQNITTIMVSIRAQPMPVMHQTTPQRTRLCQVVLPQF